MSALSTSILPGAAASISTSAPPLSVSASLYFAPSIPPATVAPESTFLPRTTSLPQTSLPMSDKAWIDYNRTAYGRPVSPSESPIDGTQLTDGSEVDMVADSTLPRGRLCIKEEHRFPCGKTPRRDSLNISESNGTYGFSEHARGQSYRSQDEGWSFPYHPILLNFVIPWVKRICECKEPLEFCLDCYEKLPIEKRLEIEKMLEMPERCLRAARARHSQDMSNRLLLPTHISAHPL